MPIDFVPQLLTAAIRACGLGLIAFVGLLLFRVRSASARHAVWTTVLAGMLLQIPLGMVAPIIRLKALPTLPAPTDLRVTAAARIVVSSLPTHASASVTQSTTNGEWPSWSQMLTGVYLAISMLLFARMALGSLGLRRILRGARPIPSLGPGILESALVAVPGTVGCFRARIILPRAFRDWDAVKLRAVLAHEGAHLRRRDWLIRVASHVNVCVFWFHPLAWWMERELARLAEEACDDVALSEIEDREDYAAALVDIARAAAADGAVLNWRVISMARESNVARRVNRILEARRPVTKPFGRAAWVALFACSLPVIYLSAAVRLVKVTPVSRASTLLPQAAVPAPIAQAAPNQPVRTLSEDPPITMCILIDNSGSMWGKRDGVKAAALALIRASKPRDEVCILDFNDEVFSGLPRGEDFTSDITEMEEALTHIEARGGKAMRDAVRMAIDQVEHTAHNNRKVLVLVTEGNDSASTVTQEQLLGEIRKSGVRVYGIGLVSEDEFGRAETARLALGQLAEASGGKDYYPKDVAEVESMSPEIANAVRKQ
jgi:beta-lactamase regulating signal transducer with metallopeptidase domain/Mg-chelatase subunit ChlD